jgi:outer membrane protein assembly factor BamB
VHVVADPEQVYATNHGKVHRLHPATGKILWTNNLRGLGYGLPTLTFAPRGLAPHGLVFVGLASTALALDAMTGEERWRHTLPGSRMNTAFTHLVLLGLDLYATVKGELYCLNAESGDERWRAKLRGHGFGLVSVAPSTLAQFSVSAAHMQAEHVRRTAASS